VSILFGGSIEGKRITRKSVFAERKINNRKFAVFAAGVTHRKSALPFSSGPFSTQQQHKLLQNGNERKIKIFIIVPCRQVVNSLDVPRDGTMLILIEMVMKLPNKVLLWNFF
jgi:hypothetical protein